MRAMAIGFIIFAGAATHAGAASVPSLNYQQTCQKATRADAFDLGTSKSSGASKADAKQAYKNCISGEVAAKKKAAEIWPKVKAFDRKTCADLSASFSPSYVELATCLTMYAPQASSANQGGEPVGSIPFTPSKPRQPRSLPE